MTRESRRSLGPKAPSPYVGARPFERTPQDQARFFGREAEAQELLALLFGEPLVVLCAESGAGKSSLCEARLVPELQREGFEVLRTSRVSGAVDRLAYDAGMNPYVFCLVSTLTPLVKAESFVGRTLKEHLGTLARGQDARGRQAPRLLIIDQAEELFTFFPEGWEAHRSDFFIQLRDAIGADPLLRILIVLRDDYVARLARYAHLAPGGLRVRYQIERLTRAQAQQAIEEPLGLTSRRYADGVSEQIASDLSRMKVQDDTGRTSEAPGPHVEPVHMQVVCDELWNRLSPDTTVITLDDWKSLGNVDRALARLYDAAVDACVTRTGCNEERVRAWFEERLITPAHTRGMVFSGASDADGVPNTAIGLLERRHLIRAEDRAGGRWFELTHDRLVEPILQSNAPFKLKQAQLEMQREAKKEADIARQREKARRRTRKRIHVSVALAAILVSSGLAWWRASESVDFERTEGRLQQLRSLNDQNREQEAAAAFDAVASYLRARDETERLVGLLRKYEDLIPRSYALESVAGAGGNQERESPLKIHFSSSRTIDRYRLLARWRAARRTLQDLWGLPVSGRVSVSSKPELAPWQADLSTWPKMSCEPESADVPASPLSQMFTVPDEKGYAVVSARDARTRLKSFYEAYETKFRAVESPKPFDDWILVPRWTLPIFKIAGVSAQSYEATLATLATKQLLVHPELALSCEAVRVLLGKVEKTNPVTVQEVYAARGGLETIRSDLVELVRKGVNLRPIAYLLDLLADYPDASSIAAAAAVRSTLDHPRSQTRLSGPRAASVIPRVPEDPDSAFKNIPDPAREMQVEVGEELMQQLSQAESPNRHSAEFAARLHTLERDYFRRWGLMIPDVHLRPAEQPSLTGFHVQVLADRVSVAKADPGRASLQIVDALRKLLMKSPARWVSPDMVAGALDASSIAPATASWLRSHYSVTDLKHVLRTMLGEDPALTNLRETTWLLTSLVFFQGVGRDPGSTRELAGYLRELQRRRLQPSPSVASADAGDTDKAVLRGIAALVELDMGTAAREFRLAAARDRDRAIASFFAEYPRLASLDSRAAALERASELPDLLDKTALTLWSPSHSLTLEVEDLLEQDGAKLDPRARRKLQLYLLAAYGAADDPSETSPRSTGLIQSLLRDTQPEDLSAEEGLWLGYAALRTWRSSVEAPESLAAIRVVLTSSLEQLERPRAESAASRLVQGAFKQIPGCRRWSRELLGDLAAAPTTTPGVNVTFANALAAVENESAAKRALAATRAARERTPVELSTSLDPYFSLAEARALLRLSSYDAGATDAAQRAREMSSRLVQREPKLNADLMLDAVELLAESNVALGDYRSAAKALKEAIRELDEQKADRRRLAFSRFFVELAQGQTSEARTTASLLPADSVYTAYLDALIGLLDKAPGYDAAARRFIYHPDEHEYKDYLRVMYSWRLYKDGRKDEADRILNERYERIQSETWNQRLAEGDPAPWREMLVAYFLNQPNAQHILGEVDTPEAFAKSPLRGSGLAFEALRTEGYFYAALREQVTGPENTREQRFTQRLRLVEATRFRSYYEYHMARYLLETKNELAAR